MAGVHAPITGWLCAPTDIRTLSASPDGSVICALGADGVIRLIERDTHEVKTLDGKMTEPGWDFVLPSNRDGIGDSPAAFGLGANGSWFSWTKSGFTVRDLDLEQPLGLSASGAYAAGWRPESGLVVVDCETGAVLETVQAEGEKPTAVAFSPTSRFLAVASGAGPNEVTLWNLRSASVERRIVVPDGRPQRMVYDADERELLLIAANGSVSAIDLEDWVWEPREVNSFPDASPEDVQNRMAIAAGQLYRINEGSVVCRDVERVYGAGYEPAGGHVIVPVFVATNRTASMPPTLVAGLVSFFMGFVGLFVTAFAAGAVLIAMCFGGRAIAWKVIVTATAIVCLIAIADSAGAMRRFSPESRDAFGPQLGAMTYAVCDVTIPARHREKGELSAPFRFLLFEVAEDANHHVILESTDLKSCDEYFDLVKARVQKSPGTDALVFIHGYNVSFEDAVRRTGQLAYDLEFGGAPICFSWPSHAREALYFHDITNAEASVPYLQTLLKDVAARSGAKRIHVIAHSMGNRILTQAIETQPGILGPKGGPYKNLVFAAPDVDKGLFLTRIAPRLGEIGANKTLYASSRDWALALSKRFNGKPRAGDTLPEMTCCAGLESIDCSDVDGSLDGHGYVFGSSNVMTDVFFLLNDFSPEKRFGIVRVTQDGDTWWRLTP